MSNGVIEPRIMDCYETVDLTYVVGMRTHGETGAKLEELIPIQMKLQDLSTTGTCWA